MKVNSYKLCLSLFLAMIMSNVNANCRTIRMAYINFPPYFSTQNGRAEGEIINYARNLGTEIGCEFSFSEAPIKRIVEEMVIGDIDMWMGVKNFPQFNDKNVYISDKKILTLNLNAYFVNKQLNISSKESLKKIKIAVFNGFSYGGLIEILKKDESKNEIVAVNNHNAGIQMIKEGRVDIYLNYDIVMKDVLKSEKEKILEHSISKIDAHIVLSAKYPNAKELMDKINKKMKLMSVKE